MSVFVGHIPCKECGSKDNFASYRDNDGHLSGHCFGCSYTIPSKDWIEENTKQKLPKNKPKVKEKLMQLTQEEITIKPSGKPALTTEENQEIKSETSIKGKGYRSINDDVYKAFGVRHAFDKDDNLLEQYYPCTQDGQLVGYKVREEPKNFFSKGRTGAECELFMQFKFGRGGKYILITEGELDALSAYQMLKEYNESKGNDFETAVVSSTVGAGGVKQIASQYKFLDSFDNIILSYDNDKAGRDAVDKLLPYLPKGKVKVMPMRYKDANEYLTKEEQRAFVSDFYNAKKQVPVGVLPSDQLYDRILAQSAIQKVPFPPFMGKLNEMFVGGMPLGHIINVAADTGIGKCFAKGTKIRMFNMTTKNVEDIKNGDEVMGDDGTPRIVKGVTTGEDTMYKITQVKGIDYVVNSAHILSLRATCNIKTLHLLKGDVLNINVEEYLKLPKTYRAKLKGYKADISNYGFHNIEHDYLIGLWLGDGTTAKPQITFGKSESELLEWFKTYCEYNNWNIGLSPSNDRSGCITYDITGFRSTLKQYNLLNNKHIPFEIMQGTLITRLNVIAGIIDADGYLSGGCYTLTLKDNQLACDFIDLVRSVGLAVTATKVFKKCQNFEGDYYIGITISGNINKIPVKLSKRKTGDRKQIKNVLNTGISVTKLEKDIYYGFTLDGNHLFCLEDFTVTHNTTLVNEMIYYWVFHSPHKIGVVSMELDAGQYGEVLLSRHLSKKIALIENQEEKMAFLTSEKIRAQGRELMEDENGDARFYLLDNRDGSIEEIQDTIEELVVACGAKVIVLDPLQDILDGLSNEEQATFMKWAKGFIKSHGITFVFINHMRKSEDGADNEQNIMGSSTIIKSASANILLKRDKMSEDAIERNTTQIRVPKNRIYGLTGPAGAAYYDNETHTLHNLDEWLDEHGLPHQNF